MIMTSASDNTVSSLILVELAAGSLFLLILLVTIPMIGHRIVTLERPSITDEFQGQTPAQRETQQAVTDTLASIEQKLAALSSQNQTLPQESENTGESSPPKGEHSFQELVEKFESLDQRLTDRLARQEDPFTSLFQSLERKTAALLANNTDNIQPLLDALNQKAASLALVYQDVLFPASQTPHSRATRLKDDAGNTPKPVPDTAPDTNHALPTDAKVPPLPALAPRPTTPPQKEEKKEKEVTIPPLPVPAPRPTLPSPKEVTEKTAETGADSPTLRAVQGALRQIQIETTLDPTQGSLILPPLFDFNPGSSQFTPQQLAKLNLLAEALVAFLPCHAYSPDKQIQQQCHPPPLPKGWMPS